MGEGHAGGVERWGVGGRVEHEGKDRGNVVGKVRREKKKEKLYPVSIFHT